MAINSNFTLSSNIDKNQIFVINRSELEGRFDTAFYTPEFTHKIKKISSLDHFKLGSKILKLVTGYNNIQNENNEGVKFIRTQNIRPINLDIENTSYTSDEKLRIPKIGSLLFTRIGANVGDVAFNHLGDFAISDNVIAAELNDEIFSKYVVIYLNTDIGKIFINREKRDTARAIISYENIKNILIPNLSRNLQNDIIEKIETSYSQKLQKETQAKALLESIDTYILNELGITLPEKDNSLQSRTFTSNFCEVSGSRFDPYFNLIFFKKLINNINDTKYTCKKLKDVISFIESGSRPSGGVSNINEGILSFGGEHVNDFCEIEIAKPKYIPIEFHERIKNTETKKLDILLVKDGATTGKIGIIENPEFENQNINEHVFMIRANDLINPYYLVYLLHSQIGQIQIQRVITGATVTGLTKKVVKDLIIPYPSPEKQNIIADHIKGIRQQANNLKAVAITILEKAKQEVEKMIIGE